MKWNEKNVGKKRKEISQYIWASEQMISDPSRARINNERPPARDRDRTVDLVARVQPLHHYIDFLFILYTL